MSEERCPCGQPAALYTDDGVRVCQACYDVIPPTPARSEAAGGRDLDAIIQDWESTIKARALYPETESDIGVMIAAIASLRQQLAAAPEDGELLDYAAEHHAGGDMWCEQHDDSPCLHIRLPENIVFNSGDNLRAILRAARATPTQPQRGEEEDEIC